MTSVLPSLTIATLSTAGYILGDISASTSVPLGEAVGGFVFIAGLVWWIAQKLQRIEDDVRGIKAELAARPCHLKGECLTDKEDDE